MFTFCEGISFANMNHVPWICRYMEIEALYTQDKITAIDKGYKMGNFLKTISMFLVNFGDKFVSGRYGSRNFPKNQSVSGEKKVSAVYCGRMYHV